MTRLVGLMVKKNAGFFRRSVLQRRIEGAPPDRLAGCLSRTEVVNDLIIGTSFVGEWPFAPPGSRMQRGIPDEESNLCLSAWRSLGRRHA